MLAEQIKHAISPYLAGLTDREFMFVEMLVHTWNPDIALILRHFERTDESPIDPARLLPLLKIVVLVREKVAVNASIAIDQIATDAKERTADAAAAVIVGAE